MKCDAFAKQPLCLIPVILLGETLPQFVIPAKTRVTGREPVGDSGSSGNPELFEMILFSWIPDLTSLRSVRPE